ncbi:transposase [Paenibacillus macerans]|uniref:transposase n=1 Tax=Paenibacillus macerans TaxID=44252 RepID=UPI00203D3DDE|nr:transposase [Paenibacillus macerans]MCM3698744.1 transposase [Paenibacillus macerans]
MIRGRADIEVNAGTELQPFSSRYNSEQACMEALIAMKWPSGFVCQRCAHSRCSRLTSRCIPLFECGKCKHQTSALVGTIFEGTHLPLPKWFKALELFLLEGCIPAMRLSQVTRVLLSPSKLSRTYLLLHQIFSSPELVCFSATLSNGIIVQSVRTASVDLPPL